MLCGTLLQRVGDVGAGDMSLIDPASPFSIVLSTFCMMLLSQQRIGRLYGVRSLGIACGIWIDEMSFFLICFHRFSPLHMIVPRTPPMYNPASLHINLIFSRGNFLVVTFIIRKFVLSKQRRPIAP
jgi:hypothetical protein